MLLFHYGLKGACIFQISIQIFCNIFGNKNILKGNPTQRKQYIFISKNVNVTFFVVVKVLFYFGCNDHIESC